MTSLLNHIQNNSLAALQKLAPANVTSAIKQASARTGVDFAYLMQQAKVESSFKPDAKAKTSSASGLYQFIKSTWMNMVDKYAEKHGIDTAGKSETEILEMRNDPKIASKMAAEFARENKEFLDTNWGGKVGSTELYMAHFMGAGGAAAFLNARDENGSKTAAYLFPAAAKANKNVFYDSATGRAKTLDEVYAFFDTKFTIPEEVQKETVIATAAKSYEDPFREYAKPSYSANDIHKALMPLSLSFSSNIPSNYQSMLSNPIELMLLSQLDMPLVDSKAEKYSIF